MMNEFFIYLLKVMLFQGICYAMYWTLFRKSNCFSLNRAFLLCTLILGFIAPTIRLSTSVLSVDPVITDVNVASVSFSEVEMPAATPSSIKHINGYSFLIGIIYAAGVLVLLVRGVVSLISIWHIRARGLEKPLTNPKVITTKAPVSFSFINTIVLQESADPAVFLHEKGHVIGKHWLDLFFMEVVCTVCWMNPLVWLYRKSLRQQHEYLADDYVLHHGVSCEHYLLCILNSLSSQEPIGHVHKFNSQSLKQRISMMTKDQFQSYSKTVYIGILPLVALLFLSFTGKKGHPGPIDAGKVIVIDAAHGGSDAGSTTASGISEKDIALDMAKLVQQIGKKQGLSILLTRTTDQQLSLKERVDFSAKSRADVFLSLHVGFERDGAEKGSGIYVSEENGNYANSKRMAAVLGSELDDIRELGGLQVRNSSAYVLKQNPAASAIVEVGHLTDTQDGRFISDPANQRRIAEKIVSGLTRY